MANEVVLRERVNTNDSVVAVRNEVDIPILSHDLHLDLGIAGCKAGGDPAHSHVSECDRRAHAQAPPGMSQPSAHGLPCFLDIVQQPVGPHV